MFFLYFRVLYMNETYGVKRGGKYKCSVKHKITTK